MAWGYECEGSKASGLFVTGDQGLGEMLDASRVASRHTAQAWRSSSGEPRRARLSTLHWPLCCISGVGSMLRWHTRLDVGVCVYVEAAGAKAERAGVSQAVEHSKNCVLTEHSLWCFSLVPNELTPQPYF